MRKVNQIKFVKQEERFGCVIACIAMVLGKTYSEIRNDFINDFDKKGIRTEQMFNYLGENGCSIVHKTTRNYYEKDFARKEMLRPFAHIHIVGVKLAFDSTMNHVVVMDEKGKLICPQEIEEKEIKGSYEIVEVVGIYK